MAFNPPTAGELRDRVRLEERRNTDDGYGNVKGRWVTVATGIPAKIEAARGGEVTRADRLASVSNFDIHVRRTPTTSAITNAHRLVNELSGETYDVKWSGSLDARRTSITLVCQSVTDDG